MSTPVTAASDLALGAPVAARLADWGVIRAKGDDAAAFLNGQLTQETLRLDVGQARLAGYCSPKGRLLASFVMWSAAPDEILLACSADLLAPTLKRLSMFVLRAKCRLTDASGELALWGVALPGLLHADAPHPVPAAPYTTASVAGGTAVRLADAAGATRVLWAAAPDAIPPWATSASPDVWNWLEVQSGVPRIVASTVEAFVPQMVNLELVGGVNFQKGCYPARRSWHAASTAARSSAAWCWPRAPRPPPRAPRCSPPPTRSSRPARSCCRPACRTPRAACGMRC